ncbi:tripartite tricarboxylate transporter substrate binding protein [Acidovorax sp. SUPP2522]|uniref:Bug family tripartite tricarboxylate transporter substrate binding protein n=1 Tax=unclassified Acidovorax TaxID=2684926 RepID=UPI00234AF739|nr:MULTISPECIES: tripartite tricarboxylate transporter substrate binding protein [unclassified Acidovorax]WCM98251.1 tripartite tricarboxylate transporter substrate binding protein [Acidovorax sp. GBBC 1281]GKT18951.1 tripartite tricarboxylate transporter substrate binding protein [Acidovorax sp. SUPP2522]
MPLRFPITHRAIRRIAAALACAAATTFSFAAHAEAAGWPRQPITLILGFPAGSGIDVVARAVQEPLSQKLGQPIVIDYKSGAAGNIASEFVARARPDGYTLAFGTAATHGSNAALYPKLPFDVENDFVPVGPLIDVSNVLTINPDVIDAKTLQEFVALVKAHPGQYNYASTGNGAGTHMAFAEFNARLGLDMVHVPYKGGPEAITSVVRGETCCIMNQVQTVLPHYKAGKVRLLGVTTAKPVAAVKEVPTIASSGLPGTQGFDSSIWFGLFAPKGTDAAVVQKLNTALRQVLEQPEVRERFESQGNAVRIETPAQFRQTVHTDRAKWAQVVKDARIRID